jgi:hypothetical protein
MSGGDEDVRNLQRNKEGKKIATEKNSLLKLSYFELIFFERKVSVYFSF